MLDFLPKRQEAVQLLKDSKDSEALVVFQDLWNAQGELLVGLYILMCLRRMENYRKYLDFYRVVRGKFGNPFGVQNEIKWYLYKLEILRYDPNLEVAESIIKFAKKYPEKTKGLFIATILGVAERISSPRDKLLWLDKLNPSALNNIVFRFNSITYPSQKKRYFLEYAKALMLLNKTKSYIDYQMKGLGFKGEFKSNFTTETMRIIQSMDDISVISHTGFAQVIKSFSEERYLRKKQDCDNFTMTNLKLISVSDLSHYVFCPVSYAIAKSHKIYENDSLTIRNKVIEKIYLADRYRIFKHKKDFNLAFKDTFFLKDNVFRDKFKAIFESKMEVNNITTRDPVKLKSDSGRLIGAPDYIFVHPNGKRFILTEKFSYGIKPSVSSTPFESDLIKHLAYLEEFRNLDFHFGLLLTWYYTIETINHYHSQELEKKIVINGYDLTKIKSDQGNKTKLNQIIAEVSEFSTTKRKYLNGKDLSSPRKCLKCSVVSYCHHKTGRFDLIELPYQILSIEELNNEQKGIT